MPKGQLTAHELKQGRVFPRGEAFARHFTAVQGLPSPLSEPWAAPSLGMVVAARRAGCNLCQLLNSQVLASSPCQLLQGRGNEHSSSRVDREVGYKVGGCTQRNGSSHRLVCLLQCVQTCLFLRPASPRHKSIYTFVHFRLH